MFARRNGDGVLAVRLLRMRRVKYFPTGKYTSRRLPLKLHFLNEHIHTPRGVNMLAAGGNTVVSSNSRFIARPLIIHYAFLIPHYTLNFPTSSASPSILSLFFRAKSLTSCTARLICGRQRELFERYNGVTARMSFSDGENFIWKI